MNTSFLKLEIAMGWRYVRANKNRANRFVNFISLLSSISIALGVMALIVVMSVMNGFQKEVRTRMLSVISHIEVFSFNGSLPQWQPLAAQLKTQPAVRGISPYVSGQAMLARGDTLRGALIRGIEPSTEGQVSDLPKLVAAEQWQQLQSGAFNVILGAELARNLGVTRGDAINMIIPSGTMTPAGMMPRMRKLTVAGTFDSGHFEYDSSIAVLHREDAAKLFEVEAASGLRLKIDDMDSAPQVAFTLRRELAQNAMQQDIAVTDWSRANRNWFAAVQVEKRMMFIILTLIIAVAAFNLVSMLVMTVTEKTAQIAILRTLGASPGSIRRIFMVQGFMVGCIGVLAGTALGVLLASNLDVIVPAIERLFNVQFLPKEIYFISQLPSDIQLKDVLSVTLTALFLALLATLYPSARAANIEPAKALRYE